MTRRTKTLLPILILLAGLAAPAMAQDDGMSEDARKLQEELQAGAHGAAALEGEFVLLRVYSDDEVRDMFSGHTNRYVHPEDGTRVEYTAPDGTLYLWHPRQAQVLRGRWRVDGNTHLCYDYTRTTGGFFTRGQSAGWDCETISMVQAMHQERARGDIFDLAERNDVPFNMRRRDRMTLSELAARARPPEGAPEVAHAEDEEEEREVDGPWWRRVIFENNSDRDPDMERVNE